MTFLQSFSNRSVYDQNYKEGLKAREWYLHFANADGQARVDKFLIYFKQ